MDKDRTDSDAGSRSDNEKKYVALFTMGADHPASLPSRVAQRHRPTDRARHEIGHEHLRPHRRDQPGHALGPRHA